jgi:hypothetical protein
MRGNEAKDAFLAGYAAAAGERYYGLGAGAEWTRRMSHSVEELSRARSGYGDRYDDWEEEQTLREEPWRAPADMLRALTQLELLDLHPDRWMDVTPDQFYPGPRPRGAKEPVKGKDPLEAGAKGKGQEKGWAPERDNEPAYWRERRMRRQGMSGMEEPESWRRFTQPRSDGSSVAKDSKSRGKGEGPKKGRLEAEALLWGSSSRAPVHLQESADRLMTNALPQDDLMMREHFYMSSGLPPALSSRDAGWSQFIERIHGDSHDSAATDELRYFPPARSDIWGLEEAWEADTRGGQRAPPRDGI